MTHSYIIARIKDKQTATPVRLPPEAITVLTQVRGASFEIDQDLLPSTLAKGQFTPGVAAALTHEEAVRYVEQLNAIFNSHHTLKDLTMVELDGVPYAIVLIVGHRRLAAVRAINEMILRGEASHTDNFDGTYRVELRLGITAEEAIELQFNENRHTMPPLHVEARKAWGYYRWLMVKDPSMTHGEFAKRIGRTTEWMKNAMRFCNLPLAIQGYVDGQNTYKARLPYGVLVHLARLIEGLTDLGIELPEEGQHYWLLTAFTESLDTTAFGKKVSDYLADKRKEKEGQMALFDLTESLEGQQRRTRAIVSEQLTRMQWVHNSWLDDVSRLANGGAFGNHNPLDLLSDKGAFSPGSPVRVIAARLRQLEILLPIFAQLARRDRTGHVQELEQGIPVLQNLRMLLEGVIAQEENISSGNDSGQGSLLTMQ